MQFAKGTSTADKEPSGLSYMYTYENERWYFMGWSGKLLPTDRPHWSDASGRVKLRRESLTPPTAYTWAGPWEQVIISGDGAGAAAATGSSCASPSPTTTTGAAVNTESAAIVITETDKDGWSYATDFPSKFGPTKCTTACVRRRLWRRPFRLLTPAERLAAEFASEFAKGPAAAGAAAATAADSPTGDGAGTPNAPHVEVAPAPAAVTASDLIRQVTADWVFEPPQTSQEAARDQEIATTLKAAYQEQLAREHQDSDVTLGPDGQVVFTKPGTFDAAYNVTSGGAPTASASGSPHLEVGLPSTDSVPLRREVSEATYESMYGAPGGHAPDPAFVTGAPVDRDQEQKDAVNAVSKFLSQYD